MSVIWEDGRVVGIRNPHLPTRYCVAIPTGEISADNKVVTMFSEPFDSADAALDWAAANNIEPYSIYECIPYYQEGGDPNTVDAHAQLWPQWKYKQESARWRKARA